MMAERPEQGDRGFIGWTPRSDSATLVEHILSVVHYYRAGGYPEPTVRDVSRTHIDPADVWQHVGKRESACPDSLYMQLAP